MPAALQVYLKGFTEGVLKVGPHAGKKVAMAVDMLSPCCKSSSTSFHIWHAFWRQVSEIKSIIRQELIDAGQAVAYAEPEKQVMSEAVSTAVRATP